MPLHQINLNSNKLSKIARRPFGLPVSTVGDIRHPQSTGRIIAFLQIPSRGEAGNFLGFFGNSPAGPCCHPSVAAWCGWGVIYNGFTLDGKVVDGVSENGFCPSRIAQSGYFHRNGRDFFRKNFHGAKFQNHSAQIDVLSADLHPVRRLGIARFKSNGLGGAGPSKAEGEGAKNFGRWER